MCVVYKVKDGELVVDVQRIEGDIFAFLDFCGKLQSQLRAMMQIAPRA